jgi:hypothetical protein
MFLQVGAATGLGLTLDGFLRQQAARADLKNYESKEGKAKSVIHIFLPGGAAHQETWDPKPNAPIEYRGEMGVIKTKLDGVYINECLKKTAEIADKIAICRSMTHGEAAHERGTHNMFTGYRPSPALQYPSFGSVVSHEFGVRNNLPPYVCVPSVPTTYAGSGYLSSKFAPFALGSDPANPGFTVQDLALPGGVDDKRFTTRKNMLSAVNDHFATKEKSDNIAAMDTFYQQAYSLISSPKAKEAFNINAEDAKLRDEYGRNAAGQRMLMARRLVEAGVRFVSLTYGGWDMHGQIKQGIQGQLPQFDQAFATLITDLEKRGLLDSTLVMISSEFGRTPKINGNAGRDHWAPLSTLALAGGGLKMGQAVGESTAKVEVPKSKPIGPQDLMATIFHVLGIPQDLHYTDPTGRPSPMLNGGKPIAELV